MGLAKLTNFEDGEFVEFNATPSQGVSRKTDVTNQPVERKNRAKSSVTDHISSNPNQINLDITLSNFDDETIDNFQDEDAIPDTVSEKMDIMERWQTDGTLLLYEGHNRIDDDVLIIDFGDTFATATGESFVIKLSLLKIRIAESTTAEFNAPKTIRKVQKKGTQDPKAKGIPAETEADSEETKTSWTDKLFTAFR